MTKWPCDNCGYSFNELYKNYNGEVCHECYKKESEKMKNEITDSVLEKTIFWAADDLASIIGVSKLYLNDMKSLIAIVLTILIIFSTSFYQVSENSIGFGFKETADVRTDETAVGITISGNYAYLANGYGGLKIINIEDQSNPTLVGGYDTNGIVYDVAISGNYAYLADGSQGLRIINIEDPTDPTFVGGYYDTGGFAEAVTISGDYAYVANGQQGLLIINIEDPTNPTFVGRYDTDGYAEHVIIWGNLAYVADGTNGLEILSIEDPASPTFVGWCDTGGRAVDIAISGLYAYIADSSGGLAVIDIEDPTLPTHIQIYTHSEKDNERFVRAVTISGDYAYVADDLQGIIVINIEDPVDISLQGSHNTRDARGVAISGNYAYVADGEGGLEIMEKTSILEEMIIILSLSACLSYLVWRYHPLTIRIKIPEVKNKLKTQIAKLKEKGIKTEEFEEIIKKLEK